MDNRGWIIGFVGSDKVAFITNAKDCNYISEDMKIILKQMDIGDFIPLDDIYVRCVTKKDAEYMEKQYKEMVSNGK